MTDDRRMAPVRLKNFKPGVVPARHIMPNCQPGGIPPMKPLLSCLALLLIGFVSSSLYAQSSHPELSKEELKKNKIKSISEDTQSPCDFDRSNAAPNRGGWASNGSSYDARGNQTSNSHYSTWEGRGYKNYYNYDDKDNLVEEGGPGLKRRVEHKITRNDQGKILEDIHDGWRHTFKYNAAGNLIESAVFHTGDGGLLDRETYNDKGDLIEAVDGTQKIVYTYDGTGHRTKRERYSTTGGLISIFVYAYDEAGHNIKEEEFASDGKTLKGWSTYKLDAKGLVTEVSDFDADGKCKLLMKTTYEFYP
jgi:YD repeat-containing protein